MKIRNKTTGEIIEISPEEAYKYGVKASVTTPAGAVQAVAPQKSFLEKWLAPPEEAPTAQEYFKGLPAQAGKDIGEIGKGVAMLGGLALTQAPPVQMLSRFKDVQRQLGGVDVAAEKRREMGALAQAAPTIGMEAAKGVVKDYVDLAKAPVKQFYKKPVTTALDVAAVAMAAQKAGKTIKGAVEGKRAADKLTQQMMIYAANNPKDFARMVNKMGAEAAPEITKKAATAAVGAKEAAKVIGTEAAGKTDDAARAAASAQAAASATDNVADQEKALRAYNQAVNSYAGIFTVPTKRANDLKPVQTARDMIRYGVSGDFDDLTRQANKVTGQNGLLSGIARDIVNDIPEINTDEVASVVKELGDTMTEIDTDDINKVTRLIATKLKSSTSQASNVLLGTENVTGYLDDAGAVVSPALNVGTHPAENAYDVMKQLDRMASDYGRKSTYLTPNMRMEQLEDLYRAAARSLENSIFTQMDDVAEARGIPSLIDAYKTPENLAKLQAVSPVLADDFAKIKSFRQLRALQAPFVRLSQLVDITRQQALSTFNKVGAQMAANLGGGIGRAAGLGPLSLGGRYSPIGILSKTVAAPFIGPFVQGQMESTVPKMITRAAIKAPMVGAKISSAVKAAKTIAGAGPAAAKSVAVNAFIRRLMGQLGKEKPKEPQMLAQPAIE